MYVKWIGIYYLSVKLELWEFKTHIQIVCIELFYSQSIPTTHTEEKRRRKKKSHT